MQNISRDMLQYRIKGFIGSTWSIQKIEKRLKPKGLFVSNVFEINKSLSFKYNKKMLVSED